MNVHAVYGPSLPEAGWVPAPSYLLRRRRILAWLKDLPPGRYLEVGCGPGALVYELRARGFDCKALETSPEALEMARQLPGNIEISRQEESDWVGTFDYLAAFEVLEHIENDRGTLDQWKRWLRPGGRLLISVPAHQRKWNASDVWAGHYRRYEREQLRALLVAAGFEIHRFESYGFPLANLIEPIRARYHARQLTGQPTADGDSVGAKHERSRQSGVSRSLETRLYPLQESVIGVLAMRAAFALQRLFIGTDLGTGYLVLAKLR